MLATLHIQTGSELRKYLSGKTFGEDVGILGQSWDMQDTNITNSDMLSDKVEINLDVLRTLMLHRVGGHVYSADVVVEDHRSAVKGTMELSQELCSQDASATPFATARYSTSTLDPETVF